MQGIPSQGCAEEETCLSFILPRIRVRNLFRMTSSVRVVYVTTSPLRDGQGYMYNGYAPYKYLLPIEVFRFLFRKIFTMKFVTFVVLSQFESGEEEALLTHAENWSKELDKSFPNRLRKTTVVDMHCQEVFITRYLAPLNPPQEIMEMASEQSEQLVK